MTSDERKRSRSAIEDRQASHRRAAPCQSNLIRNDSSAPSSGRATRRDRDTPAPKKMIRMTKRISAPAPGSRVQQNTHDSRGIRPLRAESHRPQFDQEEPEETVDYEVLRRRLPEKVPNLFDSPERSLEIEKDTPYENGFVEDDDDRFGAEAERAIDVAVPQGETFGGRIHRDEREKTQDPGDEVDRDDGLLDKQEEVGDDGSVQVKILKTTNTSIAWMLGRLKGELRSSMCDMESRMVGHFQDVQEQLKLTRSELEELQAVGTTGSGTRSSGTGRTALSEWNQKLDGLTPHLGLLFKSGIIGRVVSANVIMSVMAIANSAGSFVDNAAEAVATVTFGKLPTQTRSVLHEGIGLQHCQFRHSAVLNLIFNLQRDSFHLFKRVSEDPPSGDQNEDACNTDHESSRFAKQSISQSEKLGKAVEPMGPSKEIVASASKIPQPRWLQMGFILGDDVHQARLQLETPPRHRSQHSDLPEANGSSSRSARKKARKTVIKETPTTRDIAVHGAKRLFSAVIGFLHDGRDKSKTAFAEELGYLMVDWYSYKADADQERLSMQWAYPDAAQSDRSIAAVDITILSNTGVTASDCDKRNTDLLRKQFSQRKDMILLVRHDVFVVSTCTVTRKRHGGDSRPLRRAINLCEVAVKFLVEFTQCGNEETFLRSHESALKIIVCVAVVFRQLITEFLDLAQDPNETLIKVGNLDLSSIAVRDVHLSDLLPGFSVMKRVLDSKSLRMNETEYARLNISSMASQQGRENGINRDLGTDEDHNHGGSEIVASSACFVIPM